MKTIEIIKGGILIGILFAGVLMALDWIVSNRKFPDPPPCSFYAGTEISRVPARCVSYFISDQPTQP